ncbi:MAG TPA: hemolysin family protein [Beijerinckiaceae bacterium]|nr:hemolysin family protein [Beijerinckiaceae bacterium]
MLELTIALVLIALNGVFALSELAIVSARKPRLKVMADARRSGARAALALAEDPGRFLSTVQIGITLVGILAGAFSGAALGARLTAILTDQGVSPALADPLGYGLVIGAITYLSVIIGELVPKHLALRNAEGIACTVAPAMALLSRLASPIVWLLDASTRLIFNLFGQSTESASAVTEEEIKTIVAEAETAGVIEFDERRMIAGVLRLGDRPARAVMTPRTAVDWIDLDHDDEAAVRALLGSTPHSRLPVAHGDPDNMIGVVQARAILADMLAGKPLDIRANVRQAPVVPDTLDALDVLQVLREAEVPMALVHDEYGHFEGLVTPVDVLEAIAGAFRSDDDAPDPDAVRREDGSWLLAGSMPADEMAEQLGIALPAQRKYHTVAGLIIGELQHLPTTGERVEALGWRFEVVDLDGRRVDKVLATPLETADAA